MKTERKSQHVKATAITAAILIVLTGVFIFAFTMPLVVGVILSVIVVWYLVYKIYVAVLHSVTTGEDLVI